MTVTVLPDAARVRSTVITSPDASKGHHRDQPDLRSVRVRLGRRIR